MVDVSLLTPPTIQQDPKTGAWNTMTSTKLLGAPVSLPLLICPTGMARLSHPSGERAFAEAAGRTGIIQVVSKPTRLGFCAASDGRADIDQRLCRAFTNHRRQVQTRPEILLPALREQGPIKE